MSTLAYAYESGYQDGLKAADTEKAALERRIDELCAEVEYDRQTSRSRLERIDQLQAEVERLRQENQSIRMAAYEVGYRDGSIHYELEHCPACKNIADLQEALEENAKLRDENAKLRELVDELYPLADYGAMDASELDRAHDLMRELGIEVPE